MALATLTTMLKRLEVGERFVRRNPLYYSAVERELDRLETAEPAVLRSWTDERVLKTLRASARTSYGRSVGAPRALQEWPLLGKESVRNQPQAFIRSSSFLNARATTGGTTGLPLKLLRSPESVVAEQACQDKALVGLGLDPVKARLAVLRADDVKDPSDMNPPYWIKALGGRRLILSANHLSERTLPHYVAAIREFAPDVLWVYPTPLESLCLLLQNTGSELRVPHVMSSSEVLQPAVWELAVRTLGCSVVDRYGQAERVACAHAFEPMSYRFVRGYSHVELIRHSEDEAGVLYEIVGTTVWNTAMPLVRYRTGDLLRLPRHYGAHEVQEVAAGLRTFEGVLGRTNDVLLAPDGAGVLTGINHLPRGVPNLLRLQVVQERPDLVVLRVLAAAGFSAADEAQLLRNVRRKLPETMTVRVDVNGSLHRTAGGKTPYVVHAPSVEAGLKNLGMRVGAADQRGVA
jgi:phenylacetate-CoA ligase